MFYFAYGSNLHLDDLANWARDQGRAVELRFAGRAYLPDHTLRFHYRSPARGGGALDVFPRVGATVSGVLFETESWEALDAKEGVATGRYQRIRHPVVLPDGGLAEAISYRVADTWRQDRHVAPTDEYLNIVRAAFERWGLDPRGLLIAAEGQPSCASPQSVFVYGTLKRGHCRSDRMERADVMDVREASVAGTLLNLGPYPGLTLGGGVVRGQLWTYQEPRDLLEELDAVEDFTGWHDVASSLYVRTCVQVECGGGDRSRAWTYVYRGATAPIIESGVWSGA